jgi:hypothetical protein
MDYWPTSLCDACEHLLQHGVVQADALDAMKHFADAVMKHLPKCYWTGDIPATATVPLYDVIDDMGEFILDCGIPLLLPDSCYQLKKQCWENEARMNGLTLRERREGKKMLRPDERTESAEELVKLYFAHTPFLEFFYTQIPFRIERERFNEHGAIFARSGHGKTRALRSFIAQFLQEPDPPAMFLIDSLGALIEGIDRLEIFNTTLRNRLVILDPSRPEYMPRLNLFTGIQSDELIFYLFKAIDQSFTQRQATMASYLMEYMRHVPSPDLLKLVELCKAKENPYPELLPRLSRFARLFFEQEFFASGKGADPFVAQTKAQIGQRLFTLGRMPKFNEMFSASGGIFDAYEHMQRKSVVLINTDARSTLAGGLGQEGSAIFGRYILALCLEAARIRPRHQRHLALIFLDEAKAYMDEQAALILSDARQFGLGMMLASQNPHQLEEGVRKEINTNTSIRMLGNLDYATASQYSKDMFCQPEFILKTKKYDYSHAEWATFVSGMDHAVKVDMPYSTIEKMTKSSCVNVWRKAPAQETSSSNPVTKEDNLITSAERMLAYAQKVAADNDRIVAMYEELKAQMEHEGPSKPEPAKKPSPRAPASLRDTDLPLPLSKDEEPKKTKKPAPPQREILEEQSKDNAPSEPLIKPGKDWD